MKVALFLFLAFASSLLCAQRTDTTEVKNGMYGVFQRDAFGNPKNPVAVFDSTGRLLRHVSYRDDLLHGPVIWYDSLGRKAWLIAHKKGQKHGPDIFYYPDGTVQWKRSNRNGKHHGASTSFHPNGRVEWTKAYRHGKLHGERILRDSTGALFNGEYLTVFPAGMGHYRTICTNGRPHGELIVLRGDGMASYTGSYNKGYPDGEFLYFNNEGKVYRREYYSMGKFLRSTEEETNATPTP
ncbi:MAG: hypothetical protein IPM46_09220 [Flavobacteriales bacterium]|nr:hypothetical protein [Flavobacteriales bacterium]